MLDAEICGGILAVMTPLYRIQIRLPARNRQDPGNMTRTVRFVR